MDSVVELCEAVQDGDGFVSRHKPVKMGNAADIAYGGCALAFGINAASQTVPEDFCIYTAAGNYLGPALTTLLLRCKVTKVRSTKTFSTRFVEIGQEGRTVMTMLVDFHKREPASLLTYSIKPRMEYSRPESIPSLEEWQEFLVKERKVPRKMIEIHRKVFGPMRQFFETRGCPEGIMANTLNGMIKKTTIQDDRSLTDKLSADWGRCPVVKTPRDSITAVAFFMDGAVSFLPLAHNKMFLDDAGACSSLDFSLRFFSNDLSFDQWHLRELSAVVAGNGRTYSESRLFDSTGNLVALMSQQSILRPKL